MTALYYDVEGEKWCCGCVVSCIELLHLFLFFTKPEEIDGEKVCNHCGREFESARAQVAAGKIVDILKSIHR